MMGPKGKLLALGSLLVVNLAFTLLYGWVALFLSFFASLPFAMAVLRA